MKTKAVLITAIMITMLSGCLWAPGLDSVRKEIQAQIPGSHFDREFAISLGPVSLTLARVIVGMVDDDDAKEAHGYLKEISKVKVAIYDAYDIPRDINLTMPSRLGKLMDEKGWEMAVKVRDDEDNVWILYKEEEEVVRNIYVIVLSSDELVLVQAEGNLDRLFEKAMSEHVDFRKDLGI